MMRSLLYVPANSERFIARAHERGADAIILDLEDSVPEDDKDGARDGLADAVRSVRRGGAQVLVRVNSGERLNTDALAASRAGADALYVPKARSAEQFEALSLVLEAEERSAERPPLKYVALIEDPAAVLDAKSIAAAPRLLGLSLGGEDLALALGAKPTPEVLRLPKLLVHYAAKSAGLLSFGLLRSVADYSDREGIIAGAREAREHGFDGATCVHPSAVPLLNAAFGPNDEERDWAKRVLERASKGEGSFELDGKMVDAPVIARARAIAAKG
jgi:citrate lyase subunit beta / citryl-CoA lyase